LGDESNEGLDLLFLFAEEVLPAFIVLDGEFFSFANAFEVPGFSDFLVLASVLVLVLLLVLVLVLLSVAVPSFAGLFLLWVYYSSIALSFISH